MGKVEINVSLDLKDDSFSFRIDPDDDAKAGEDFGDGVTWALLEAVAAIMSSAGLAKWQIVENLVDFIDNLEGIPTAAFAKSIRVIEGGRR